MARTGNFSRAARQCRAAQPSLSQQIQKLEDELGERLFDRLKREAKLAGHGETVLRPVMSSRANGAWLRRIWKANF